MMTKGRNGKKFVKIHDNKMSTYGKQLWQEIVSKKSWQEIVSRKYDRICHGKVEYMACCNMPRQKLLHQYMASTRVIIWQENVYGKKMYMARKYGRIYI